MAVGSGDRLARGAARASYGMPNVTKERWDEIFGTKDSGDNADVTAPGISSPSASEPESKPEQPAA